MPRPLQSHRTHVQLILSSVRAARIGDQIADWLIGIAADRAPDLTFELIDLKDWYLPMDDEPLQPKQGSTESYSAPHSRAWSRKVREAAGYIFLLPQYNWGYPASLKNALDHLYHEWTGKPAVIVTYGSRGGGKAADQLSQVLDGLHMQTIPTKPALPLKEARFTPSGRLVDPAESFAAQADSLDRSMRELAESLRVTAD